MSGFIKLDNSIIERYAARIGPHAFMVYCAIARYANSERRCFPSTRTLQADTAMSRPTIIKAINTLQAAGLLEIEVTKKGLNHVYRLTEVVNAVYQSDTEVVNAIDHSGKGDLPVVVNVVYHSGKRRLPELDLSNKTNLTRPIEQDKDSSALRLKRELSEWFETCFWPFYPRKDNKKQALQRMLTLKPTPAVRGDILVGLETAKKSDAWRNERGRYIPMAATWLNNERWNDRGLDTTLFADSPPDYMTPGGIDTRGMSKASAEGARQLEADLARKAARKAASDGH